MIEQLKQQVSNLKHKHAYYLIRKLTNWSCNIERWSCQRPKKTEAVRNWTEPNDVIEVRSFLGLCSFFIYKRWCILYKTFKQVKREKKPFV